MLERNNSAPQLDHERLDAYTAAVELDALVVALTRSAPRGHAWLGDQAQRASASVVLNLAEALGREGADRARMLRISKGSALELDAALTLLAQRGACRMAWAPGSARADRTGCGDAHRAGGVGRPLKGEASRIQPNQPGAKFTGLHFWPGSRNRPTIRPTAHTMLLRPILTGLPKRECREAGSPMVPSAITLSNKPIRRTRPPHVEFG